MWYSPSKPYLTPVGSGWWIWHIFINLSHWYRWQHSFHRITCILWLWQLAADVAHGVRRSISDVVCCDWDDLFVVCCLWVALSYLLVVPLWFRFWLLQVGQHLYRQILFSNHMFPISWNFRTGKWAGFDLVFETSNPKHQKFPIKNFPLTMVNTIFIYRYCIRACSIQCI